ncbi:unnamed protein product [Rotaria sordida]|nr:unnamed protein product [Rotaria sordida]
MVTKDGRFQSQRVLPRMALIRPSVVKDGLCLRAPNMPELNVSVNPLPDEVVHCYCWTYPILGLRYGDHVSYWLRTFLQTEENLDLVAFDYKQFEGRPCKNSSDPNSARDGDVAVYHDMSPINFYRLKPNPYGVSPLFGINVAPTDENSIGAMIRVGDMVYVRTEEPDFWSKIDSLQ